MKRGCWSYARIDETPLSVSAKLANTGDRFMDSILVTWRPVVTYIRCEKMVHYEKDSNDPRADSRFASSQWEAVLLWNFV